MRFISDSLKLIYKITFSTIIHLIKWVAIVTYKRFINLINIIDYIICLPFKIIKAGIIFTYRGVINGSKKTLNLILKFLHLQLKLVKFLQFGLCSMILLFSRIVLNTSKFVIKASLLPFKILAIIDNFITKVLFKSLNILFKIIQLPFYGFYYCLIKISKAIMLTIIVFKNISVRLVQVFCKFICLLTINLPKLVFYSIIFAGHSIFKLLRNILKITYRSFMFQLRVISLIYGLIKKIIYFPFETLARIDILITNKLIRTFEILAKPFQFLLVLIFKKLYFICKSILYFTLEISITCLTAIKNIIFFPFKILFLIKNGLSLILFKTLRIFWNLICSPLSFSYIILTECLEKLSYIKFSLKEKITYPFRAAKNRIRSSKLIRLIKYVSIGLLAFVIKIKTLPQNVVKFINKIVTLPKNILKFANKITTFPVTFIDNLTRFIKNQKYGSKFILGSSACMSVVVGGLIANNTPQGLNNTGGINNSNAKPAIYFMVHAKDNTTFSNETTATIEKLPFRIGDSFNKGDVLLEFDCRVQKAELRKVLAQEKFAESAYKSALKLSSYDYSSEYELTKAKSEDEVAKAEVDRLSAVVDKCTIKAPYEGAVSELMVHVGESVKPGDPLLKIVNTENLELELQIPSKWLAWLKIGTKFNIYINETQQTVEAMVAKINPEIDSVSQTVRIIGNLVNKDSALRPGMSGEAYFEVPKNSNKNKGAA